MALDAATLALVANELNSTLLDAKIDKIFEPTRDEVLMTLRTRTQTFKLLLSARSGSARVCLTKESFENPLTPPGFCMLLRKHLTGGRLTGLHMEPGDRIVFFDFLCTNEMGDLVTNTLAAELMGRYSNLVLIQSGKIIDALKRVDFEDSEIRQLLPGLPYTLPPKPNKPDFLATSAAAMVAAACEKDLPVASALGKAVGGVGPVVAREAMLSRFGHKLRVAIDGKEYTGTYMMAAICNGGYYGGGYQAAPYAAMDDGLLDIVLVKPISRIQVAGILAKYKAGRHMQDADTIVPEFRSFMTFYRARSVEMQVLDNRPIIATIDGECAPVMELKAEVLPSALNVLLPRLACGSAVIRGLHECPMQEKAK